MSREDGISRTLNQWGRDGLRMLSSPDSHAFQNLLEDYFTQEDDVPDSTSQKCIPGIPHYYCNFIGSAECDEDFGGHYYGDSASDGKLKNNNNNIHTN